MIAPHAIQRHPSNAQPRLRVLHSGCRRACWAMMMRQARRSSAIQHYTVRCGFLSQRSYVAPSRQRRSSSKRPRKELTYCPIYGFKSFLICAKELTPALFWGRQAAPTPSVAQGRQCRAKPCRQAAAHCAAQPLPALLVDQPQPDDPQPDQRHHDREQQRLCEYLIRQVAQVGRNPQRAEHHEHRPAQQHCHAHQRNVYQAVQRLAQLAAAVQ